MEILELILGLIGMLIIIGFVLGIALMPIAIAVWLFRMAFRGNQSHQERIS